jgi:3-hydroxyisobutyrate dehydrogenase
VPDWLAAQLGIGHPQLAEVIKGGPLDAPIADAKFHNIDRRDYAVEFALEKALKDVDLALGTAGGREVCGPEGLPGADHAFWCAIDGGIRRSLKRM